MSQSSLLTLTMTIKRWPRRGLGRLLGGVWNGIYAVKAFWWIKQDKILSFFLLPSPPSPRPDITVTVDWALRINYLSVLLLLRSSPSSSFFLLLLLLLSSSYLPPPSLSSPFSIPFSYSFFLLLLLSSPSLPFLSSDFFFSSPFFRLLIFLLFLLFFLSSFFFCSFSFFVVSFFLRSP